MILITNKKKRLLPNPTEVTKTEFTNQGNITELENLLPPSPVDSEYNVGWLLT